MHRLLPRCFTSVLDRASQCPIISSIEQIQSMQLLKCFKQECSPRIHVQQRYYVDGLHVSPSVVPRVFAALHEAGVLEGAALWRESSQKLFLTQYNIMPLGQKIAVSCCLASGSDLLLTDSCLVGFDARQVREAFEHLSQAWKKVSCLSFLYVPQCFAAGVRWRSSGQSVATGPRIRQLACSRARGCQFHPRVAGAQLFIAAQGHLVPRVRIFFGHSGVARKWPDESIYQPRPKPSKTWWRLEAVMTFPSVSWTWWVRGNNGGVILICVQ